MAALACPLCPGCFEDVPIIDDPVTDTTPPTSTTGSGPATSSSGADGSSSSGAGPSTTSGGLDSSSGGSSSSGCESDPTAILWAEDATVVLPMELVTAVLLPGTPAMARSYAADLGTIRFDFELACPTTVYVHGLVWDITGGPQPQNADSFHVMVDEGAEWIWAYGCATEGLGDMVWAWLPIDDWAEVDCDIDPVVLDLPAGAHELTLRNREAGSGNDFAAIAAIVITDDPAFDPTTLYDPGA